MVAAQMLNHCFEFGANKQRLKVWFAQSALAALQVLALNDTALSSNRENEFDTLALIQNNFSRAETFWSLRQLSKFHAEPANRMD